MPRRAASVLAAAASLAASAGAIASPPAISAQAGSLAVPGVEKVATGPARSLGEPGRGAGRRGHRGNGDQLRRRGGAGGSLD